jgi:hypothetical protein
MFRATFSAAQVCTEGMLRKAEITSIKAIRAISMRRSIRQ